VTPNGNNQETEEGNRPQDRHLTGSAIAPGLAEGKAFVYRDILSQEEAVSAESMPKVDVEHARLDEARETVLKELDASRRRVEAQMTLSLADIFRAHDAMLRDPVLLQEVTEEIEGELIHVEEAIRRVFCRWVERFRANGSTAKAGRAEDVADLARRLLRALRGIRAHPLEEMPDGSVLVAQRLAPSDAVHFCGRAAAVVVEFGTPGAHCALMARQVGIPVVGNIPEVVAQIPQGASVLVDGLEGTVVVNPDEETRARFQERRKRYEAEGVAAKARACEAAVTVDGVTVQVAANITSRADAELADENGADGVGLFRTEALFMYRNALPSEDELVEELSHALEPLAEKPSIVRLLDVGGDKNLPYLKLPAEESPFLGRRGIRLLLAYPELLNVQVRALLRLSEQRAVQVMVPMVTVPEDMDRARSVVESAARELGIARVPPLVAMIETPAAALSVSDILRAADALSIGTNDLTQYVMAAGRQNPLANEYFREDHPAMMRLIRIICQDAGAATVGMCGELAGRLQVIPDLLRAGIRLFSVAPRLIPLVKEAVRRAKAAPKPA